MIWLELLAGAAALLLGTPWAVGGLARLSLGLRSRALATRLLAVAFGGGLGPVAVATTAAAEGHGTLALGVLLGSLAASLGLVLGLSLLARPCRGDPSLARREVPVLLVATYALLAVIVDGRISGTEGLLLLAGAAGYLASARRWRSTTDLLEGTSAATAVACAAESCGAPPSRGRGHPAATILIGLAVLLLGSQALARGASDLAAAAALASLPLGVVLAAVAALPGLAISLALVAAGQGPAALGYSLGSSLFVALAGFGIVGILGGAGSDVDALVRYLPALVVLALLALHFLRSTRPLRRWHGALLLAVYLICATRIPLR